MPDEKAPFDLAWFMRCIEGERTKLGIKAYTFAKSVGLTPAYYSQLKSGVIKSCGIQTIAKMARACSYSLDPFFCCTDPAVTAPKPPQELVYSHEKKAYVNV